jgi:hypothetical protein
MYFRKLLCFVAAIIFSLNSAIALAEEAAPIGLVITQYHVAPGKELGFEEVSAKFKAAADKVGSQEYFGYSPGLGNPGLYAFAAPFRSYADLGNNENPLAAVYKGEELAAIGATFQDSVTDIDSYVIIPRPDLSIPGPERKVPPEVLLLISVTIKNDKGEEYAEFLKKLVEATKATSPDAYWNAFQPGFGSGPVWRFGIAMNWADLGQPGKSVPQRIMEHFGKRNGEKINAMSTDAVESIEFVVSRVRPDLTHTN